MISYSSGFRSGSVFINHLVLVVDFGLLLYY